MISIQSLDIASVFATDHRPTIVMVADLYGNGLPYYIVAGNYIYSDAQGYEASFSYQYRTTELALLDQYRNIVWKRDGTTALPLAAGTQNAYECLCLADIDGDGTLEILHGTTGFDDNQARHNQGKLYCLRADGTEICSIDVDVCSVRAYDTRGDGVRIYVAEEGSYNLHCYKIVDNAFVQQWVFNSFTAVGSVGNFWHHTGTHHMYLKDIDGDGQIELVTSGPSTNSLLWIFKDIGSSCQTFFSLVEADHIDSADAVDTTGDGKLELVIAGGIAGGVQKFGWLTSSFAHEWTTTGVGHAQQAVWGKFDGVSWDVAVLDRAVPQSLKIIDGSTGAIKDSVNIALDDGFAVYDIDHDGKDEIIAADQVTNILYVFDENLGVKYSLVGPHQGIILPNFNNWATPERTLKYSAVPTAKELFPMDSDSCKTSFILEFLSAQTVVLTKTTVGTPMIPKTTTGQPLLAKRFYNGLWR